MVPVRFVSLLYQWGQGGVWRVCQCTLSEDAGQSLALEPSSMQGPPWVPDVTAPYQMPEGNQDVICTPSKEENEAGTPSAEGIKEHLLPLFPLL